MVARGGEEGGLGSFCFMDRASAGEGGKVLRMGGGDGCTIVSMSSVPWNYTLFKNTENGKFSVMYILPPK